MASGFWKSDVFVRDKHNLDAALRTLQPQVPQYLQEWNDQRTEAIRVYDDRLCSMMRAYTKENLSVQERAKLAWTAVCFVRLWKARIDMLSYTKETLKSWPTTTEQEILGSLREAEREVLKTVKQLGMLLLLTAGNILRKDKQGEITYLNPGMESTLTDIGFEPNELDSIIIILIIKVFIRNSLCKQTCNNLHSKKKNKRKQIR